ncbi:acyl-CoA/acyl-ACP dehydrogenase [Streptomyces luomodiensis]|uniref:Acyl-CoA/acyl-ACP dehydrogenase n=1 Tax=Streptomyces luomodiensis TaxID=3026192 RepID=A0ABY9V9S9_9ACTN|nr:acyl-CoA dehydrogenase family protein [Streptomyces sp. SCA4-21]WNF01668.1 acyl-CoA/acyl-ACP dehydrogenase [Streptomyces sp. SCA4-21]
MDFQLTDDQRALRTGVRELLERCFPRTRLRAMVDMADGDGAERGAGLDRALWRGLGAAGLFALRVPESAGGVGLGLPEAVLAFEEAGRALLPGPLVATELTAGLSVPGALAAGEWAADAVRGEAVVTALDEGDALDERDAPVKEDALVEHLASADAVLVLGPTAVEVIAAEAVARSAEPIRSVDPATPLHRTAPYRTARCRTAQRRTAPERARPPVVPPGASEALGLAARLRREAALLTAAQQLGSACRTVELAVDHAKRRTQFGRPIGAFQAVQHLCAQMLVRAESARSVVYAAAVTEDPGDIAAAKLLADEAAVRNARDCLQVHGGMGFTWEADVHLHLKRAWVRAGQWQSAAAAEEELAAGLLSTVETCL